MRKVALLVLYNHNYEKNVDKVKELYRGRFSHVYQLIPFYRGSDESVIPVYENSYFFQSYLSQAYTVLKDMGFTHFFIVADDMIINPSINENSIFDVLGISEDDAYLPTIESIQNSQYRKAWIRNVLDFKIKQKGLEICQILPSVEEAEKRFQDYGLPIGQIPLSYWFKRNQYVTSLFRRFVIAIIELPLFFKRLKFPVVKGYSDVLLMPAQYMRQFTLYLGAFAAGRLFVEYAIPTSFVLTVKKQHLKTNNDIRIKGMALWTKQEWDGLEEKYKKNLKKLIDEYPKDVFYIHPVKLSRWN